jgi:predicted PurR-regulated permease PerM
MLIVRLALLAALGYFVYRVRSILVAVTIAIMLTYAILPAVEFLTRRRWLPSSNPRTRRLIATVFVFLILAALSVLAVTLFFVPFGSELAKLAQNFGSYVDQTKEALGKAAKWYRALPPDARDFLKQQDYTRITSGITEFGRNIISGTLSWVTHFVDIILIPVLAFYFVFDSRSLRRDFLSLVPRRRLREALMISRNIAETLQSYIIGQFILCLIAALLTALVLSQTRMDYVLVLSVFAGVTRAIPILGPLISGVPIILLGVATQGITMGVWLTVFVVVMHFAESKFIMPKLIGDRMKLHPALVIIVLLIGAEFFGLLGMFLAAPVAAVAKELINFYIVRPRRKQDEAVVPVEVDLTSAGVGSEPL